MKSPVSQSLFTAPVALLQAFPPLFSISKQGFPHVSPLDPVLFPPFTLGLPDCSHPHGFHDPFAQMASKPMSPAHTFPMSSKSVNALVDETYLLLQTS